LKKVRVAVWVILIIFVLLVYQFKDSKEIFLFVFLVIYLIIRRSNIEKKK